MPEASGHRVWMAAAIALTLGLGLTWGLMHFGAAETHALYRLFLLLLVPSILALVTRPWRGKVDLRFLVLVLVGVYLLGQVALQATLESRGYLHLAVGWIALWLSLWLAVRSGGQRRFLLVVLVLLGALEAFYGLIQSVGGFDYIGDYFRNRGRLATGTLINRNHYAALLNMLLPLALGMLFADQALKRSERATRSESLAKTWVVLLGCSVMGVAVLLSQSRGGTLSLLMTLLFMAMLLTLSRKKRSRRGLTGASAGVLLFLVLGMGAAFGLEALLERFGRIDDNLSRVEVYQDSVEMIGDSPLVGVGPGMYQWRFRLYQKTQPNALYDHAHNDYLETAAEWGIPLAILIWGFVFWRFYRSSDLALSAPDPRVQGLAMGTAGALFSILVHSLVDFSLQIPAILMVFAMILGLSWSLDWLKRPADLGLRDPRLQTAVPPASVPAVSDGAIAIAIALRIMLSLALLAAGYQTLQRLRAEYASQPEQGVPGLERAVELDPKGPEYAYLLGMAYRDLPGVGDLTSAAQHLQQSVRFNPYAWRYWLELSRAQELMGDLDLAEASLRVAVSLNPASGDYHWRLGNLLLRKGDLEDAVEEIAKAVELQPHLAEPAVVLLLKIGVDANTLEGLLPEDRAALARLLRTSISLLKQPADLGRRDPRLQTAVPPVSAPAEDGGLDSIVQTLWARLLANPEPLTVAQGRAYVDYLFRSDQRDEAREAWLELTRVHGITDSDFEQGANAVWNGAFERDLLGAPLGWNLSRSEAFEGAVIPGTGADGSGALGIDFLDTENLNFAHLTQQVMLEPDTTYTLTYSIRSEDLSTDQGIYFEVLSREPNGHLLSTDPVSGTTEWTTSRSEFTTPEGSGLALIRLRRRPSQQIDNKLRGKVFVDSVRIERSRP